MSASASQDEHARPLWRRFSHIVVGFAVFAMLAAIVHVMIQLHEEREESLEKIKLLAFGSSLRARLSHELGAVVFPAAGLANHLSVRHRELSRAEIQDMLASLYESSRHVRNYAIAVGLRVAYIHPLAGNEKALGLNYPDQPDQWPQVKRAIDTRQPVLIGPVDLVQGGVGLIHRMPIYLKGRYWGLLSTVIDSESLFRGALADIGAAGIVFAVRGKDGLGMLGDVFWGDPALFRNGEAQIFEFDVPGGKWAVAMQAKAGATHNHHDHLFVYAVGLLLAGFLGWSTAVVLAQRAQLARMAMFDPLTALPNRHLVEDRIARAISAQTRNRYTASALLFVDLDGFKEINDAHGHRAGDVLLQGVAKHVRAAVRAVDTVGRWGGDEFVVLMENIDRRKIPDLVENIRKAVETAVPHGGQALKAGASIGTALIPDDGGSVSDLVRAADHRMYEDKQRRRGGSAGA
jgi:diguanylate cyclase (GGDEF)-like protein